MPAGRCLFTSAQPPAHPAPVSHAAEGRTYLEWLLWGLLALAQTAGPAPAAAPMAQCTPRRRPESWGSCALVPPPSHHEVSGRSGGGGISVDRQQTALWSPQACPPAISSQHTGWRCLQPEMTPATAAHLQHHAATDHIGICRQSAVGWHHHPMAVARHRGAQVELVSSGTTLARAQAACATAAAARCSCRRRRRRVVRLQGTQLTRASAAPPCSGQVERPMRLMVYCPAWRATAGPAKGERKGYRGGGGGGGRGCCSLHAGHSCSQA